MIALLVSAAIATATTVQLPCEPRPLYSAAHSPRLLLACRGSPDLYLVDGATGATVARVAAAPPTSAERMNLAIAPDGRSVAVAWRDGTVSIWHDQAPDRFLSWKERFYANSLSFAPDGARLLVDGRLVDEKSGLHLPPNFAGAFDAPNAIAFDARGRTAFVAEADTTVRSFDLRTGKETARYGGFMVEPMAIGVDQRSGLVIAGLADGSVNILTPELRLLRTFPGPSGTTVSALIATGGKALVVVGPQTGGSPPKIFVFDLRTGNRMPLADADGLIGVSTAGPLRGYWAHGRELTIKPLALGP